MINKPAFPVDTDKSVVSAHLGCSGLSKLEWFAGQSISSYISGGEDDCNSIAKYCFNIAEAMLKESKERGG